jgi:hypothetical protein
MMNKQKKSAGPKVINGFPQVDEMYLECMANITGEQAEAMSSMFRAIARLTNDEIIIGLCEHGRLQADLQANDIDVMRERVVKAGLFTSDSVEA